MPSPADAIAASPRFNIQTGLTLWELEADLDNVRSWRADGPAGTLEVTSTTYDLDHGEDDHPQRETNVEWTLNHIGTGPTPLMAFDDPLDAIHFGAAVHAAAELLADLPAEAPAPIEIREAAHPAGPDHPDVGEVVYGVTVSAGAGSNLLVALAPGPGNPNGAGLAWHLTSPHGPDALMLCGPVTVPVLTAIGDRPLFTFNDHTPNPVNELALSWWRQFAQDAATFTLHPATE